MVISPSPQHAVVILKSESEVAQLCLTLWPHGLQPTRLQSTEFSRQGYWSGLPFPSPGDPPDPGSNLGLRHCRQTLLPSKPPGKSKLRTYQTPTLFHTPPWINAWSGSGGSAQKWSFYHCYGSWCWRPERRARSGKVQSEWKRVSPRFLLLPHHKVSSRDA